MACDLQEASFSPLSRSRMQRLQESAVHWVYPTGWPKIHHPSRLPSALPVLAELLSEAPRRSTGTLVT